MIAKDYNYYNSLMKDKDVSINHLSDRLAVAYRYRPREVYFINKKEKRAWLVLDKHDDLLQWEKTDVDFGKLSGYDHIGNAKIMCAPYGFNIHSFNGNRALVSWTLHPDGRYFADEDGFGMTDDEEVKVYGVINDKCEVVVPFQPMGDDDFKKFKLVKDKRSLMVMTGIGVHGDEDKFIKNPDFIFKPGKAHELIAGFEAEYDVTVVTTCPDECHEQAGSSTVHHLLGEKPDVKSMIASAKAVNEADICILVGCKCNIQPLRNIIQFIRPSARLYICYYNDGEGKMPRIHNVVKAFTVGTFAPPEDGIDTVIKHLQSFPLE